jgi:hypothetical protein
VAAPDISSKDPWRSPRPITSAHVLPTHGASQMPPPRDARRRRISRSGMRRWRNSGTHRCHRSPPALEPPRVQRAAVARAKPRRRRVPQGWGTDQLDASACSGASASSRLAPRSKKGESRRRGAAPSTRRATRHRTGPRPSSGGGARCDGDHMNLERRQRMRVSGASGRRRGTRSDTRSGRRQSRSRMRSIHRSPASHSRQAESTSAASRECPRLP